MNNTEFNRLVDDLRESPLPPCPGNLEDNVLRRIRLSREQEMSLAEWLLGWLGKPVFIAASLALVSIASFATVSLITRSPLPMDPVAALDFSVITEPITLPTDH